MENPQGAPELVKVVGFFDGSGDDNFTPAIKITVSSAEQFTKLWWSLSNLHNSSCGCGLFVNDGQHFDLRIMDTKHTSAGERSI